MVARGLDGTSFTSGYPISSLLAGLDNTVFQVVLSERRESMFRALAVCFIKMASLTFLLYQLIS